MTQDTFYCRRCQRYRTEAMKIVLKSSKYPACVVCNAEAKARIAGLPRPKRSAPRPEMSEFQINKDSA